MAEEIILLVTAVAVRVYIKHFFKPYRAFIQVVGGVKQGVYRRNYEVEGSGFRCSWKSSICR